MKMGRSPVMPAEAGIQQLPGLSGFPPESTPAKAEAGMTPCPPPFCKAAQVSLDNAPALMHTVTQPESGGK